MTQLNMIGLVNTDDLLRASETQGTTVREKLMRQLIVSMREQISDLKERVSAYAVLFAVLGFTVGFAAAQFVRP